MSRRQGGRSGVSARITSDVALRLRDIRAVWYAVTNDPHNSVEALASEFYFIVGDLLEGKPLNTLPFLRISKERVLAYAED